MPRRKKESVRVLLVADDAGDVTLVRRLLQSHPQVKFNITAVPTAREGLQKLEAGRFDVALVDYRLPDENGLAFLRQRAERQLSTPTILFARAAGERVAADAMKLGAEDYLPHADLSAETLTEAIRQAVEKSRQKDEEPKKVAQALAEQQQIIEPLRRQRKARAPMAREEWAERGHRLKQDYTLLLRERVTGKRRKNDKPADIDALIDELCDLHYSGQDVMDLHLSVFTDMVLDVPPHRLRDAVTKSHLLLVEVMGRLVDCYRRKSEA